MDWIHNEITLSQHLFEIRHCCNRLVYHATKPLPHKIRKPLRRVLFSPTPSNSTFQGFPIVPPFDPEIGE